MGRTEGLLREYTMWDDKAHIIFAPPPLSSPWAEHSCGPFCLHLAFGERLHKFMMAFRGEMMAQCSVSVRLCPCVGLRANLIPSKAGVTYPRH